MANIFFTGMLFVFIALIAALFVGFVFECMCGKHGKIFQFIVNVLSAIAFIFAVGFFVTSARECKERFFHEQNLN